MKGYFSTTLSRLLGIAFFFISLVIGDFFATSLGIGDNLGYTLGCIIGVVGWFVVISILKSIIQK
jgi:hypothetical protein